MFISCQYHADTAFRIPQTAGGSYTLENIAFVGCGSGSSGLGQSVSVEAGGQLTGNNVTTDGKITINEGSIFTCSGCRFGPAASPTSMAAPRALPIYSESFLVVNNRSQLVLNSCVFQNIQTRSFSQSDAIAAVEVHHSYAEFNGCTFDSNSYETNNIHPAAACIYTVGVLESGSSSRLNVTGCTFSKNEGSTAILAEDQEVFITNTTFKYHKQGSNFVSNGGVVSVEDCVFTDNVDAFSSPLRLKASRLQVPSYPRANITRTQFARNFVFAVGGAVNMDSGTLWITDSEFDSNTARNGAAVYASFYSRPSSDIEQQNITGLVITNCTFTSQSTFAAGASTVFVDGTVDPLIIVNSTFSGNRLEEARGAALDLQLVNGSTVVLLFNRFYGNDATTGDGGAMYLRGNANMYGNEFTNNTAGRGGALYLDKEGNITAHSNTFQSNIAKSGGAICVQGTVTGNFTFNEYRDNLARSSGGAIFLEADSDILFEGEVITGCSADSVGGAITVSGSSRGQFRGCSITNTSTTGSGAVNCMGASTPTFHQCNITNNTATQEGGGIYIQDTSSPSFSECDISYNNCSTAAGGIVASENAQGQFDNCVISYNSANNNAGGIKVNGYSTTQFTYCVIQHNTASGDGGGVSVEDYSNALFMFNDISRNTATSAGGGIAIHGTSSALFEHTHIHHNLALSHGGGCSFQDRSEAQFNNCTIEHNISPINGGGLVAMDLTTAVVKMTKITNNQAYSNGGGIQLISFAMIVIEDCVIANNTASSKGGGIQIANYCYPKISNTIIAFNNANNGGGVSQINNARPTFANTVIANNTANSQGGGLLLEDSTLGTFTSTVISNNTAYSGSGGGILALDYSNTTFTDCTIEDNFASASGSGIQTTSNAHPSFFNSKISRNGHRGVSGGGIMSVGTSYPYFKGCTVQENFGENGAGLYAAETSAPTFEDGSFQNNTAYGRGGGIYLETESLVQLIGTRFSQNTAYQGGAIFCDNHAKGNVNDTTFCYNRASGDGGAVYVACAETDFSSPWLEGNNATRGGAFFLENCVSGVSLPIVDTPTFQNNWADENGGAVYIAPEDSDNAFALPSLDLTFDVDTDNQTYTFVDATFVGNSATLGGAVFLGTMDSSVIFGPTVQFNSNTATQLGGAIFMLVDPNLYSQRSPWLYNASFSSNRAFWAGSTVAFNTVPPNLTKDNITLFCVNCDFKDDNTSGSPKGGVGYQTPQGFATMPAAAVVDSALPCKSPIELTNNSFTVGLELRDEFNTTTRGEVFLSINFTSSISVDGDQSDPCAMQVSNPTQTFTASGVTKFQIESMQGVQGGQCLLQFGVQSYPSLTTVYPTQCSVLLEGCPSGSHPQSQDHSLYDTCEENTGISLVSTVILSSLLLLVLLILILIFCYCLFVTHRHQNGPPDRYVGLLPDFDRSKDVTIYDILNDPQIPVIPWEEFTKQERIGIGGSGIVWRGEWRNAKGDVRGVAMKQLLFGIDNITEKLVVEFLREIKLMSALRHANVVEFLGVSVASTSDQELYLVTELMHNGSLADLFAKKRFNMPWSLRLRLIQDAATGMAYLHSRNLIHRDLKSHNLLVNDQWICKIADFGISTIKPAAEKTMTCIGTPVYMAPEVIAHNKYSEKADIFSFGVLLVEAYTLNPPYSEPMFEEMTQAQLMYRICHQNLRPPTDELPPPLSQLAQECWNAAPEMRPSFPEIIIRLHRLETLSLDAETIASETPRESSGEEIAPRRNIHTYTTFHEMIAPSSSPHPDRSVLVMETDDDDIEIVQSDVSGSEMDE